jgi:hypothetical protein
MLGTKLLPKIKKDITIRTIFHEAAILETDVGWLTWMIRLGRSVNKLKAMAATGISQTPR